MKTVITSLFLLITFASTSAQDLDFVHSYGSSTEGSSNDKIRISKHFDEFNKVVVAGSYYEQINLEIGSNSTTVTAPDVDDLSEGIIAIYNQDDWSLSSYLSFDPLISDVILLSDTTMIVMGVYSGPTDLDPRPSDSLIYEGEIVGDGFVGLYSADGTPHWVSTFSCPFGLGMTEVVQIGEQILVGGFFFNADFAVNTSEETVTFQNGNGTDSFILSFDRDLGTVLWHKQFGLSEGDCTIQSLIKYSDNYVPTLQSGSGEINISIDEENVIEVNFENGSNSYLGSYNHIDNAITSYATFKTSTQPELAISMSSGASSNYGIVTAYYCRGNTLSFNSSSEESSVAVSGDGDLEYLYMDCLSDEGLLKWSSQFPHSELDVIIQDIAIDHFKYTYVVGYYEGIIFYEGEEIIEENDSPLNNGFIMKLDPLGNLVWAHNIPSQQGELEVNSISVNQEQDILISGYYTGNHDFDLSENTQYVGNFEEENGFLARYTQELNEAQVFLNVPILHTEIEEDGANSIVHVSINREISEDVVLEATPDEQIDLGNGAGQPVELTFTPDGEKIMSLEVVAFDDLDVEGDHTGAITFSSSGETNFASLDAQTVTFDIIDNDPDAVEEQNSDAQISVYPNPATDEIKIDYPENLPGKTIDLIRILDVNGRVVLEIKDHPKNQKLSVEDLRRCSYIMQVNTGKNEFTTKLLLL